MELTLHFGTRGPMNTVLEIRDAQVQSGDGRTQFMGDVGDELRARAVGALEGGRHVVEGLGELPEFIPSFHTRTGGEVAPFHPLGRPGQAREGLQEPMGETRS